MMARTVVGTGTPRSEGSLARAPCTATKMPERLSPVSTPVSPGHATEANGIAPRDGR